MSYCSVPLSLVRTISMHCSDKRLKSSTLPSWNVNRAIPRSSLTASTSMSVLTGRAAQHLGELVRSHEVPSAVPLVLTSEPVLRLSSHWRTGQAWQACTLLLPDHSFSLPWQRAALRGRGFHRGGVPRVRPE